jgi:diguanylate cyclase (GGDEF)-like protein
VAGLDWLSAVVGIGGTLGTLAARASTSTSGATPGKPDRAASRSSEASPLTVYPEGASRRPPVPAIEPPPRTTAAVAALLRDIRDLMRADETIFWRWDRQKGSLKPESWSSDAPRPSHFLMSEWGPLVQWAAEELLAHAAGDGETTRIVCAPVIVGETLAGVLSITSATELRLTRGAATEWLRRHASQLANLLELQELQHSHRQAERRGRLLLDAAARIQSRGEPEELARSICQSALDLTGAMHAALVRWDQALERATLQCAAPEMAPGVLPEESLVNQACASGLPIFMDDARQVARKSLAAISISGGEPGSFAIVPLVRDGETMGALVVSADGAGSIGREEGRNLAILGSMAISALEISWRVEEVGRMARQDSLTGLLNRFAFDEQLTRVLNETDRFGGACSLIIADLDNFKQINDTRGHAGGDSVLEHVAAVFREGIRTVDLCARIGGEELAIILPQTGLVGATELAERLRARLAAAPVQLAGGPVPVTASFGVASYPEAVKSREALHSAADKALYQAKGDGRNCVRSVRPKPYRSGN